MSSNAVSPIIYDLQQSLGDFSLRHYAQGYNLQHLIKNLDFKVIGWLALATVAAIFLIDLFNRSYPNYARSLAFTAADFWENNKVHLGFANDGRGSRSLEPLTEVLDALASSVKKWEKPQEERSRSV
ncbi:uncharacterized protein [Macrobrachium rosenbergii]|uniref:uncharacterized protein n=1 Tax=Macrobrachium rosenbergii TaxID=79674 RepID=UPI0034D65723